MLRVLIISPDTILAGSLVQSLEEIAGVQVLRLVDRYPSSADLPRILRARGADVIFLGAHDAVRAGELAREIAAAAPGTQVIGTHMTNETRVLLPLMQAGVREFVLPPFDREALCSALARAERLLDKASIASMSTDAVYSFLPAKPGVGASTLAVNASAAVARRPESPAILTDFDLNSGVVGFLLKLRNAHSVVDAVENAARMDEDLWRPLISKAGGLDVIQAGQTRPNFRLASSKIRVLIDFLRRNYRVVCFDLSGNFEQYSLDIMRESKRIFLVTTPELPALYLARQKLQYLQWHDLGNRVSLLLNREHKRAEVPRQEVEAILGLRVHVAFPNDYTGVRRAAAHGAAVEASSELGKQITKLADWMAGEPAKPSSTEPPRGRFIEYFFLGSAAANAAQS